MFAKKNRLAKTKDVQRVFSRGRSFFSPFFTIKFLPTVGKTRVTISVSTKVAKSAVKRNTIKRVVREYIRTQLPSLPVGDYLIVARQPAGKLARNEIRTVITQVFIKNKLSKA